jgi:hypothetical protein
MATEVARIKAIGPRAISFKDKKENQISLDLLDTDSSLEKLVSLRGYGGKSGRFGQVPFGQTDGLSA